MEESKVISQLHIYLMPNKCNLKMNDKKMDL